MLSIGCGSGVDSFIIGESFPNATVYGIDIDEVAIEVAKKKISAKGLTDVNFQIHDAVQLPSDWSGKFEYITSIICIHDIGRPDLALKEAYRVLKPGGSFLMVEFKAKDKLNDNKGMLLAEWKYCVGMLYCIPTSLAQKGGVGMGICFGEEKFSNMMKEVGFKSVEIKAVPEYDFLVGLLGKK